MAELVLLLQLGSTVSMVGLIWFVQVVHYPLMAKVGNQEFREYEREHQRLTTFVVAPLMLTELASGLLLFWNRPSSVPLSLVVVGVLLLAVVWASTYSWQVPIHAKLGERFDPDLIRRLVQSNWLRTFAWTARGAIASWMVACSMQPL